MSESLSVIPEIVLSYPAAAELIQTHARAVIARPSVHAESVPLLSAVGRVLAAPLKADRDQPPFPRSTRDGFAGRAVDFEGSAALPVDGLLRAGEATVRTRLEPGHTLEIMTGAPVPAGADCVVMLEHVVHEGPAVRLAPGRSIEAGANIVPTGAETRAGEIVLPANLRMAPRHMAWQGGELLTGGR